MAQLTPLYIIASPRPRVGKTLIARLLIEFFGASNRPLVGYDINPHDSALTGHFPHLVFTADIADTRGQMALFDQLIADHSNPVVIDLGYGPFDQFFTVMGEIGFVAEAQRRSIEPIILFVTDRAPATVRAYAGLRARLPATTFVPVHNEAVSVTFDQGDFPPSRAECRMIRIPRLSPIVRGVVDRPSFSFGAYMGEQSSGPTEIHSWIGTVFTQFRELELRLMISRLTSGLGGEPEQAAEPRRTPRT
jgi:hypothetical protein